MKEKRLCLDLCAGLGGFSRAFKDREDWEVVTVDYNSKFQPDIIAKVEDLLEDEKFMALRPDVILASPPCERWSIANSQWPQEGIYEAAKALGACLEIIARMKPKGWILENPKGRMRWFLRKPRATVSLLQFGYKTVKPTDFWTNIDIGLLSYVNMRKNPNGLKFNRDIGRASHQRAKMPEGLSQMILERVEVES